MLFLNTLGGLSLAADGAPGGGAAQQRRPLALLALLAATGRRGMSRDKVVAYLWPESDGDHARGLLKQACYALRRDLGAPDLFLGAVELQLNPAVIASDVGRLTEALDRGDSAAAAAAYTGPFLDGFHLPDAGEFERWVEEFRGALRERMGRVLEALARAADASGDQASAAGWWRRLAALDPLSARAALGVMHALNAAGERAAAVEYGRRYEAFVRQELGVEPASEVSALIRKLHVQTKERRPGPAQSG